jgi:hypothetical protein
LFDSSFYQGTDGEVQFIRSEEKILGGEDFEYLLLVASMTSLRPFKDQGM